LENVWDYPRPPALEPVTKELTITFAGIQIAATSAGFRVLETSHPPVYYLPPDAFLPGTLIAAPGGSFCEWKGRAVYWTIAANGKTAPAAGWSYPDPTPRFLPIQDFIAVYAGKMDFCTVSGEIVTPQPGGFYGGWITSDLTGPFKGIAGSMGW
jgi:uncharacterized protein (DUF427 family)